MKKKKTVFRNRNILDNVDKYLNNIENVDLNTLTKENVSNIIVELDNKKEFTEVIKNHFNKHIQFEKFFGAFYTLMIMGSIISGFFMPIMFLTGIFPSVMFIGNSWNKTINTDIVNKANDNLNRIYDDRDRMFELKTQIYEKEKQEEQLKTLQPYYDEMKRDLKENKEKYKTLQKIQYPVKDRNKNSKTKNKEHSF